MGLKSLRKQIRRV